MRKYEDEFIYFTDGSKLSAAYRIISPTLTGNAGSYMSGFRPLFTHIFNAKTGEIIYGFQGTKTDTAGNRWNINNYSITITKNDGSTLTATFPQNYRVDAEDIDGNTRTQYGFFGIVKYGGTIGGVTDPETYSLVCGLLPYYYVSLDYVAAASYVDNVTYRRRGATDLSIVKSPGEFLRDYVITENHTPTVSVNRTEFIAITNIDQQNNSFVNCQVNLSLSPLGSEAQIYEATYSKTFFDLTNFIETGNDPYNSGGVTITGGGTGTFDGSSDPVDFPALPSFSAADTGFVTLFNPDLQGLKDLAHFLWSDLIGASFEQTLNALKRVISDPMDAILSLHVVPVPVPSSGLRNVGIYDIVSTVSLPLASTQYVILDCGTLNVKEFWGAYLDYSPYTKIEIYLPYIGIESLNIDDVMNKPVHVKYYIDLLTGGCVAFVKCGNSVLYQFSGSCALPIPFNSINYTNTITGILSAAASIGGAIASGGLSAPLSAVGKAAFITQGAASAAQMASSSKPNVKKSGTMGGATGFLGIQKPYLILTRPRQAVAGFQNVYEGYPSHITSKLSDVHGFAQMEILVADGLSCSEPEKNEIVSLLESGVYLP